MGTLYERLDYLCTRRGIKGATMCRELGISKSLMTDLKSGRKKGINADTAQKLANYFDVTVGYLLGEEDEKKSTDVDGLSEKTKALIDFARTIPDDKIDYVLKLMKTILEAD